jgi:hypothetical protein
MLIVDGRQAWDDRAVSIDGRTSTFKHELDFDQLNIINIVIMADFRHDMKEWGRNDDSAYPERVRERALFAGVEIFPWCNYVRTGTYSGVPFGIKGYAAEREAARAAGRREGRMWWLYMSERWRDNFRPVYFDGREFETLIVLLDDERRQEFYDGMNKDIRAVNADIINGMFTEYGDTPETGAARYINALLWNGTMYRFERVKFGSNLTYYL